MGNLNLRTRLFGYDKSAVEACIQRLDDEYSRKIAELAESKEAEYLKMLENVRVEKDREWSIRLEDLRVEIENEYSLKLGKLRTEKEEDAKKHAEQADRIGRENEASEEKLRAEIRTLTEERAILRSNRDRVADAIIDARNYAEELRKKADEDAKALYAETREAYRKEEERLAACKAKVDGLVELMQQILGKSQGMLTSISEDMEALGRQINMEKENARVILPDISSVDGDNEAKPEAVEPIRLHENEDKPADKIVLKPAAEKKASAPVAVQEEKPQDIEPEDSKLKDSAAFISGVIENQWLRIGRKK